MQSSPRMCTHLYIYAIMRISDMNGKYISQLLYFSRSNRTLAYTQWSMQWICRMPGIRRSKVDSKSSGWRVGYIILYNNSIVERELHTARYIYPVLAIKENLLKSFVAMCSVLSVAKIRRCVQILISENHI